MAWQGDRWGPEKAESEEQRGGTGEVNTAKVALLGPVAPDQIREEAHRKGLEWFPGPERKQLQWCEKGRRGGWGRSW